MSPIWVVPVLAALAGAIVLLAGLRAINRAGHELAEELRRLDALRLAAAEVREELDRRLVRSRAPLTPGAIGAGRRRSRAP